jgi:aminoglycoside phosphotransferase (APT) family kinase protein
VVDRSFAAFYGNPATRAAAVDLVGRTLRRLHALPLPDIEARDLRALLTTIWSMLSAGPGLPGFVADAIGRVLAETSPPAERAPVLSHNDVNPTNLAYDGTSLMLLDWDTAGANDPYHDLATIAVFLRMDDAACAQLFTAYDGAAPPSLPARFCYMRRLVAGACGALLLHLACLAGHAGARGDETLASVPSLADVHARMRGGGFDLAGGDARWMFGLALLKESLAL